MASVAINNVIKRYGPVTALHGASIEIAQGEFVILVGPSGCGKSTLLRMIAGLEDISGGEIQIGARVVNDVPSKDRDIAMVFQNYALYPHMTAAENMGFSMKLRQAPKSEIDSRVRKAAGVLGLEKLLDRYPRQLSGGQRQRVAMGRAIVREPQVFLFDEPLSNLDANLRVRMRAEIKELQRNLGTTTIYVTHDQVEAMTMADKIVVMRDGRIEQFGPPLEVFDRPANTFVARFIGSPAMNILPCSISESGDVDIAGATVSPQQRATPAGQALLCGVRPEDMEIAADGFDARVFAVEPTGTETSVVLRSSIGEITCVFRERIAIRAGDALRVRPKPGTVHIFDAATERRLSS